MFIYSIRVLLLLSRHKMCFVELPFTPLSLAPTVMRMKPVFRFVLTHNVTCVVLGKRGLCTVHVYS